MKARPFNLPLFVFSRQRLNRVYTHPTIELYLVYYFMIFTPVIKLYY